jgi:hypothetical protein
VITTLHASYDDSGDDPSVVVKNTQRRLRKIFCRPSGARPATAIHDSMDDKGWLACGSRAEDSLLLALL